MSDTLSNIYPIPVEFVDGQQPTARFFNAWAEQIDEAFSLLSNVVGDFDGSGESEATFVPNLVRALGNQGWVGSRLPSGLRIADGGGPEEDLPFIEESLAAFEGQKEALLTFTPYPTEANGAGFTVANLGTAVAKGSPVITSPLQNAASRVILDGRRIITNVPIPANAYVIYPIDTASESFAESMGPVTGANVIPSLQDIMRPAEGHPSTSYLCQLSKPGGYGPNEFKLTFPEVQDVINPLVPHSVDQSDVIKLRAMGSPVKWNLEDGRSAPRYRVPQIIRDVTTGSIIPAGLCALWYRSAPGVISRVRNPLDSSDITWELLTSNNEIKITVPASLTLPSLHNEPGFAYYIVAFAGTSVAEAVRHSTNALISHSHDGRFGNQVDAFSLKGRFNPDEYTESQISHNHFPQYLLRGGYESGADSRNGWNAMLGDLLLGAVGSTPESPSGAADIGQDSHKILFSALTGPSLFFDVSDVENFTGGSLKKLRLDNAALRVDVGSIWLGEVTGDTNAVIVNSPREDDTPRVKIVGQSGETETNVEAGHFTALHGRVIFGEDGDEVGSEIFYEEDTDDALFPYTWYLDNTDGNSEKTKLVVGKVSAESIDTTGVSGGTITTEGLILTTSSVDPFVISYPIADIKLLTGSWETPSEESFICPVPLSNNLEFFFAIPRIEKIIPGIDLGKFWVLENVTITFILSREGDVDPILSPGTPASFEMKIYSMAYSDIPPMYTLLAETSDPPVFGNSTENYESDMVSLSIPEEDREIFNYETQRNQYCYVKMEEPSGLGTNAYKFTIGRILIRYVPVEIA